MVTPRRAVRFSQPEPSVRPSVLWAVNPDEAKGRLLSSRMRAPIFRPNVATTSDSLFADINEWREEVRPRLPTLILRKAPKAETLDRLSRSRARIQPKIASITHSYNIFRDEDEAAIESEEALPDDDLPPLDMVDTMRRMRRLRRHLWKDRKTMVLPQRMLVHVLNTTMIAVAPPVGAALATYSCLRGESMRATATAMVMTGFSLFAMAMRSQGVL